MGTDQYIEKPKTARKGDESKKLTNEERQALLHQIDAALVQAQVELVHSYRVY